MFQNQKIQIILKTIKEFETLIQQSKNKKVEQDRLDVLYDELQTPVIVMILFFFSQLPVFQKTLAKKLTIFIY